MPLGTVKAGEVLFCEKCGVEVVVKKDCTCKPCQLSCCGQPLKKKGSTPSCGCSCS